MTHRSLFLSLIFCCVSIFALEPAQHIVMTPTLQVLLNDMKLYKLKSHNGKYLHAGDLYEHSMWCYNAMVELLDGKLPYAQNLHLNERQKEIIMLAALLHDIGKSGRADLFDRTHPTLYYEIIKNHDDQVEYIHYYSDRQEHPKISLNYLATPLLDKDSSHFQNYYAINTRTGKLHPFNMEQLYQELNLTKEEQQIIAILAGIHYDFGNVSHGRMTNQQYLTKLQEHVSLVGYNNGVMDEHIVRLSVLIQVADVKGIYPVSGRSTPLFPNAVDYNARHDKTEFIDAFKQLDYVAGDGSCPDGENAPSRVKNMNNLLAHFHAAYTLDLLKHTT